jgi:uncharacterized protein (TIGR03437 family)
LTPVVNLAVTPAVMQPDPQADASCRFSQVVTLDERRGYLMQLGQFVVGNTDLTPQIPQLFGTTRLAPFGSLQAKVCFDGTTATPSTKAYSIRATAENGVVLTATGTATFQAGPAVPATLTAGADSLLLSVPDNHHDTSATIPVSLSGGAISWRASVTPDTGTTAWLKISPLSGNGPGEITVQASAAGLSAGAYQAKIAIEAAGASPQWILVPVRFVVGASPKPVRTAVNAASFRPVYAPGMLMSVFGSGLAGVQSQARSLPLPYTMGGVSVTVNGIPAPVLGTFPAADQINIQVPYEAGVGPAVLAVVQNGQVSAYSFEIAPAAPGLFGLWDALGRPAAAAATGSVLVAYITGDGDVTPSLTSGAGPVTGTAVSRLPKSRLPLAVTVGGVPAAVLFSGIPTGIAGATQINFTVPAGAPAGPQPVVVTVGGVASQPVTLNVTGQ